MSSSGTQSPSFNPLSTFRPCRIREGTRSSDTTVWPRAASVGATAMARRAASTTLRPGSTRSADPIPATIVRGSPIPRSRAGTASSRVSAPRLIFDASEKRTSARVVSAIRRSTPLSASTENHPSTASPRRMPAVRKKIADVNTVRPRRAESTAYSMPTAAKIVRSMASKQASYSFWGSAVTPRRQGPAGRAPRRMLHLWAVPWPSRLACPTPLRAA